MMNSTDTVTYLFTITHTHASIKHVVNLHGKCRQHVVIRRLVLSTHRKRPTKTTVCLKKPHVWKPDKFTSIAEIKSSGFHGNNNTGQH